MKKEKKNRRNLTALMMRATGTMLLVLLLVCCLPLTLPRLFGFHIYSVISGSMEPELPVGSLIYIQETAPEEIEEGEIIAFYGSGELYTASIITHRVLENRVVMGEFITKGDANEREDQYPVPYENVIGKTVYAIHGAGIAAEIFTSMTGKLLAGCAIGAAMLLHGLAAFWEQYKNRR